MINVFTRTRSSVLLTLVLLAFVVGVMAAPNASGSGNARGLQLVGADDFDELAPTRNTEIAQRGTFAYLGSHGPLDHDGLSQGVKVVDVSDVRHPRLVSNFPLPGRIMDVQANNDKDRCGFARTALRGLDDPLCNSLLVSTQTAPGRHGIWMLDIRQPAQARPWGWQDGVAFTEQMAFVPFAPTGSHTSHFFGDYAFVSGISRNTFEVWDMRPLTQEPAQPPVQVAWYHNRRDTRPERPERDSVSSHDMSVYRHPDGRVFAYVVGFNYFIMVDVTDVVEGGRTGEISDHLVAYNNYVNADGTVTVTPTNMGNTFAHNVESTEDGRFAYVGDETIWCGDAGIVRIFDTATLPAVGETPVRLSEVGTMTWSTSSVPLCSNRNADGRTPDEQNRNGDTQLLCRSSHNFRIYGNLMTHAAYCDGVMVWDITNRTAPSLIAHYRAVQNHDGKRQESKDDGRLMFNNSPYVWTALADGTEAELRAGTAHIYASDIVSGLYILRLRPTGRG
jgi:hypothetical protein